MRQPYRPNWNSENDRRRRFVADSVPGSNGLDILMGWVASAITPAALVRTPCVAIQPTTFMMTVGAVDPDSNLLLYPPYENPSTDAPPTGTALAPYQQSILNFSTTLSYSPPSDPTAAAFCMALFVNGVQTEVWVDC